MRKKGALYFLLCCFLFGCEETVDLPLASSSTDLIVVEGIVTNEKINHKIKLTKPYLSQNEIAEPIAGAIVTLAEDNVVVYNLTETPIGSGEYFTPELRAVSGKSYTLKISYNGKEFTAQDSPVPVEPLTPINYYSNQEKYLLTFKESGQDPNFIEYNIDWESTPACTSNLSCKGKLIYYDLKNVDVNELYKPDKTDFYFPLNTTIIRKKYSVSDSYKTFLRSMLTETEWRGGVFDVQRADVPTNLSKGAVGFFAVSTVVTDTTVVK
jgi:hypothetical protein